MDGGCASNEGHAQHDVVGCVQVRLFVSYILKKSPVRDHEIVALGGVLSVVTTPGPAMMEVSRQSEVFGEVCGYPFCCQGTRNLDVSFAVPVDATIEIAAEDDWEGVAGGGFVNPLQVDARVSVGGQIRPDQEPGIPSRYYDRTHNIAPWALGDSTCQVFWVLFLWSKATPPWCTDGAMVAKTWNPCASLV